MRCSPWPSRDSSFMIARAGPMRLQTADARLSGEFLRTLICPNAMPRAAIGEAADAPSGCSRCRDSGRGEDRVWARILRPQRVPELLARVPDDLEWP
jgi:hypothetical protein